MLDVEVAGCVSIGCAKKIPGVFMKPHHPSLVQMTTNLCNQVLPLLLKQWIHLTFDNKAAHN